MNDRQQTAYSKVKKNHPSLIPALSCEARSVLFSKSLSNPITVPGTYLVSLKYACWVRSALYPSLLLWPLRFPPFPLNYRHMSEQRR